MNFEQQPIKSESEVKEEKVKEIANEVGHIFREMNKEERVAFIKNIIGEDSDLRLVINREEKDIGRGVSDVNNLGPTPNYRDHLEARKNGF